MSKYERLSHYMARQPAPVNTMSRDQQMQMISGAYDIGYRECLAVMQKQERERQESEDRSYAKRLRELVGIW